MGGPWIPAGPAKEAQEDAALHRGCSGLEARQAELRLTAFTGRSGATGRGGERPEIAQGSARAAPPRGS
eukprot:9906382-Alexandrium_andersonii.AAC.1